MLKLDSKQFLPLVILPICWECRWWDLLSQTTCQSMSQAFFLCHLSWSKNKLECLSFLKFFRQDFFVYQSIPEWSFLRGPNRYLALIRLARKKLVKTNALAYFVSEFMTKKEKDLSPRHLSSVGLISLMMWRRHWTPTIWNSLKRPKWRRKKIFSCNWVFPWVTDKKSCWIRINFQTCKSIYTRLV